MSTFRACYWQSPDHQRSVLLTDPGQQHLPDDALEALERGLRIGEYSSRAY